ncbi:TetR/AcrR family transcriptional regulator [Dactylosporangium sp. CA-092794]|uniref:TetR/AcrR family transcriptional regulator n=1 Tax=Dactylosporangium sp. CA-092794 TaxID=3239929 RepID=UPI003D8CE0C7
MTPTDGRVDFIVASQRVIEVPSSIRNPELLRRGRHNIVEAAIELFSTKGFHETSVDEIAQASGLTVGALYKYIRSKHDILYLASVFQTEEVEEALLLWLDPARDPMEALSGAIEQFLRVTDRRYKVTRINYRHNHVLEPQARETLFAMERQLRDIFVTLLDRAAPPKGVPGPRKLVLTTIADNLVVLAHQWSVNHRLYSEYLDLDGFISMQRRLILTSIGCPVA